ncbi:MAG: hypothetical protein R2939_06035, partial [Kofleriaceae bacterium]
MSHLSSTTVGVIAGLAAAFAACSRQADRPTTTDRGGATAGSATTNPPGGGSGGGFATPPPGEAVALELAVASVSLADDCPERPMATGPTASMPAPAPSPSPPLDEPGPPAAPPITGAAAKRAPGGRWTPPCQQTSVQLTVRAPDATAPVTLRLARVELRAADGSSLGWLIPREPSQWDEATRTYLAWDQRVGADELRAGYALSAPDWTVVGSRGDLYTVEVTVEASAGGHTSTHTAQISGVSRV